MRRTRLGFISLLGIVLLASCHPHPKPAAVKSESLYPTARPYTRWWWFASEIQKADIRSQLDWLKENGFGGVEIAFIYPPDRDPGAKRLRWLSPEWTDAVTCAKRYAESIGLGCDFTFGTLWPFGGTFVRDRDRTRVYGDPAFKQLLELSWTHPKAGNVLNHMNRGAFERYAKVMGAALAPALKTGSRSALFCDSWEVETKKIWTGGFGREFRKRFGYDIRPFMENIYAAENKDARYDYMKLVADYVLRDFYIPFTEKCHALGAFSRVQCAGSPTDLITAYAEVDVPETEAMLYEPNFAKVVASAAALAGRNAVSSETFTCLYGFPRVHFKEEQTADLKLVADALFANGVNQIIWHGMPYNKAGDDTNVFYATVHVGTGGSLTEELPAFNRYMTTVSRIMRKGKTYSDVAVYLPLEDAWVAGEYPESLQSKWSWGAFELRYVHMPGELKGYHALWVNGYFLRKGELRDGLLHCGGAVFSSLYIDVEYLDSDALDAILGLAENGFPVCVKRTPGEPGRVKSGTYKARLEELMRLPSVSGDFRKIARRPPLVEGEDLPDFWCRVAGDDYYIFFSQPKAENLTLPVAYGQAYTEDTIERGVKINVNGRSADTVLRFEPYQSVLVKVDADGRVSPVDIRFVPKIPGM
jgi:hypothetical protein